MENLKKLAVEFVPVGSRVTCDPAPTNTDQDYLVLTNDPYEFRAACFDAGFELGGSLELDAFLPLNETNRFSSYTLNDANLIVTTDTEFFKRFMAATSVAKHLNLLKKADRISLFQAVLYGNSYVEPSLDKIPCDIMSIWD